MISLQETGENTGQWLRVGHQAEVPDRRVVLRGQVSQTHGQDPRLGNHPGLHETEESWFRCVGSILLTKGALLYFTLPGHKLYFVTCYPAAGYIFKYFHDLSDIYCRPGRIKCLPGAKPKFKSNLFTDSAAHCRCLHSGLSECYGGEDDQSKAAQFVKTLDLNAGFSQGKHFNPSGLNVDNCGITKNPAAG